MVSTPPDPLAAAALLPIGSTGMVQSAGVGQGKPYARLVQTD